MPHIGIFQTIALRKNTSLRLITKGMCLYLALQQLLGTAQLVLPHRRTFMSNLKKQAANFLAGELLTFETADKLWRGLKKADELSLARKVLNRIRNKKGSIDRFPRKHAVKKMLCEQEALLTSKDPEISSAIQHDLAIDILLDEFELDDIGAKIDCETLGIAGGILKRRWQELGQYEDLQKAAEYYSRGAGPELGEDAYCHINAAFLEDLMANTGDDPDERRKKASELRQRIVQELPVLEENWFNVATRVEAYLGIGSYEEAIDAINSAKAKPAPWELETTARQIASLAQLKENDPFNKPEITRLFDVLLGGETEAMHSVLVGKVGLALSGGGFRASFYHLGVLSRLAELDALRNIHVLSCVSGGSIIGACYWLALRKKLEAPNTSGKIDYVELIQSLIDHFEKAVATNLRDQGRFQMLKAVWRVTHGHKGALDPSKAAKALEENFYRPLLPGDGQLFMHDLPFTPSDHSENRTGSKEFSPTRHNWLRANKVPILILNSTTINTGHAWQFTPKWMGESPWVVHEAADSVPRLQWSEYVPSKKWQMPLGLAVAASAAVPGVFAPVSIKNAYEGFDVQLVDGGVYDNQGTAALLAQSCNVVLVSDAAGQLMIQKRPQEGIGGLISYAKRSMETLMERIRQANFGDLSVRLKSGLLRGMMFLHMKSGLDANVVRLPFDHNAFDIERKPLSIYGIRKEFQSALANLRTDLDVFSIDESRSLMACGYQMAKKAFERDLSEMNGLYKDPIKVEWPFMPELDEITSTDPTTDRRDELLKALENGSQIIA